ncbi:hypothetical protein STENM36S_09487 [Streptomyces tendae]
MLLGGRLRHRREGLRVEVVRRGVDQVAGAVQLLGDGGGTLDRRLVRLVAGLAAQQRGLRQRGLAVALALGTLGVVGGLLVRVEGVRAQQHALGDETGVGGLGERQGEGGLLGAGQGTGGRTGGPAQRLGVETGVLLGLGTEAHRHHDGRLEAGRSGQLRDLALGAGRAEGLQDAGEPAVVRLVHGLGARGDGRAACALGDADHDRVGPEAGRRGGGESESSHGGEISLPYEVWCGRMRVGRPGPTSDPRSLLRCGPRLGRRTLGTSLRSRPARLLPAGPRFPRRSADGRSFRTYAAHLSRTLEHLP